MADTLKKIVKCPHVKCPHCGTLLVQGDNLCCQPLKDELNALASAHGSTLQGLTDAFTKWYEDHMVKP